MLFASDLDQTLIYSRKSFRLPAKGQISPIEIRLVESKQEKEISFITNKAIEQLKELSQCLTFVPVTTRTVEQYRRISLFEEEIRPVYAITSNGGTVLQNNRVDEEWQLLIKGKLQNGCLSLDDIVTRLSELEHPEWLFSRRTADGLFIYCIVEEQRLPKSELDAFGGWLNENGWQLFVHGRKLYLIPTVVNKWDAVEYVRERTGIDVVAAAGDSLMDLCMLRYADFAVSPSHGEIYETGAASGDGMNIIFTSASGILAAEEILTAVKAFGENYDDAAKLAIFDNISRK
ncbi:HAD family hydrolase [Aneurinibacillus terranovensis]|uniref:HAD family hydrolase n=1 Tax=Aneurinibacillus terranovensis TaxID=278991 RepID=UPI00041508FE|nr:HAD family hydrolase [Aneurinibacillus terranovensis]